MKKIVISTLATTLLLSGAIGINISAKADSVKISAEQSKKLIGVQKATEVALKNVNGTVESVDLESKNGKLYYEVDIDSAKNKEYEVKVDAYTAKVLNVKESTDDDDDDNNDDKAIAKATAAKSLITIDNAIAIANKNINGTVTGIELDSDDGKLKYEIEIQTAKGEYEVTIDAKTGAVLEKDFDSNDDDDNEFDDDDDDDNDNDRDDD